VHETQFIVPHNDAHKSSAWQTTPFRGATPSFVRPQGIFAACGWSVKRITLSHKRYASHANKRNRTELQEFLFCATAPPLRERPL